MHDTPHTKEGEQEDEEEEEEAAMEEAKETADRRKQSSTTLVVSLSMPAVGFIFSCTPVGHVGGRGGGDDHQDLRRASKLAVAGSGITAILRQVRIGGEGEGEGGCGEVRTLGADEGGVADADVEGRGRQKMMDVRACVVGLCARVLPAGGGDAETVLTFGGLLSSVWTCPHTKFTYMHACVCICV